LRSRALRARPWVSPWPPRLTVAGLVYLRGQDADGRLRELVAERARARPMLGELAGALLEKKGHRELGFRSMGDWARERLGLEGRTVREWALVWKRLAELPLLRRAVLAGEVAWTVAGEAARLATPETEAKCLETVRGRTVRAVKAIVAQVRRAERRAKGEEVAGGSAAEEEAAAGERVRVRIPCAPELARKWAVACELARRVAGEELPVWACAEAVAAECASAIGFPDGGDAEPGIWKGSRGVGHSASREHGLRQRLWPRLRWEAPREKRSRLQRLVQGAEEATPRELDRRLRAATGFLAWGRSSDSTNSRPSRFQEMVRASWLNPRTVPRRGADGSGRAHAPGGGHCLPRGKDHPAPGGGPAAGWEPGVCREGHLTQAGAGGAARGGGLLGASGGGAAVRCDGRGEGLEALLDHALATWLGMQQKTHHYRIYKPDGWRCAIPGCTARRGLHAHHVSGDVWL